MPSRSPERPLAEEEHPKRFPDCVELETKPLPDEKVELTGAVDRLEEMEDSRSPISPFLAAQ